MLYSRMYYPKDRTLKFSSYGITGNASNVAEMNFSQEFDSWTGVRNFEYGNLKLKTTTYTSYSEWEEKDSIHQRQVNDYNRNYNTTDEYVLMQNNQPFTGDLSIRSEEHTSELQSHHDLVCR